MGNNGDLGMGCKPRLNSAALPIRQQGDDTAPFQVADQRAVALSSTEVVVDAYHARMLHRTDGTAAHGPEHRIPTGRDHEPSGETGCGPATEGKAEMMHDVVEPSRAPAEGSCEVWSEPLGEDLGPAVRPDAAETTDADIDDDGSTGNRQIGESTRVAAMDSRRGLIAAWALGQGGGRPGCDGHPSADLDMIDEKAARNYGTGMEAARHGRISNDRSRDPSTRLHRD